MVDQLGNENLRHFPSENGSCNCDENMGDEIQSDESEAEVFTPEIPIKNPLASSVTCSIGKSSHIHSLLENDIRDVFSNVSTQFLAGFSHQEYSNNSNCILIVFHFYTDYVETETACQWQICNIKPLTCELIVSKINYIGEKVDVKGVYQICPCHPNNAQRVPFIERLVDEYFRKSRTTLETLKYTRSSYNLEEAKKSFLEIIPDEIKGAQYQEMLLESNDHDLFRELLDYEILNSNEKIAKKLKLLKTRRRDNSSGEKVHYDLTDETTLPKLQYGFLVQFCTYLEYRMRNLNSLCVMCGKRTIDTNASKSLKPTICSDYECFSNAMDSKFRNDPLPPSIFSIEIADFLLLLIHAAIHSKRHDLILDPYPRLINPYNTSGTLIDETGNKNTNIIQLQNIIDQIMTIGSITQYEAERISLRSMLELKHPWAFSFFHWLMGTNRYHFSRIPEAYLIKPVKTEYQYFIKYEDIVKHVNFKRLRAQHGSIFAFHGSPQENWHSILRSGLRIGKGGYLLNGAAYGAGIYVSPSFQFASSYIQGHHQGYSLHNSRKQEDTVNFSKQKSPLNDLYWSCISLCEIINSTDVYKKHTNDIWTITDPNLICTRFIFFFPRGIPDGSLNYINESDANMIRQLVDTLHNIAC